MRRANRRRRTPHRHLSRRTRKSLLLVFALVFATAASQGARAACIEFAHPPEIQELLVFSVDLADIDRDGDLDLVSASTYDRIAWTENLAGDGSAWTRHEISSAVDFAREVEAGDLDGDGDLDLASIAGGEQALYWHENLLGDGSSWTTFELWTGSTFPRGFELADLDGDGDLDIVAAALLAGGSDVDERVLPALVWLEQTAPGTFTRHTIEMGVPRHATLDLGDIDRDGDIDIVTGNFSIGPLDKPSIDVWVNAGKRN